MDGGAVVNAVSSIDGQAALHKALPQSLPQKVPAGLAQRLRSAGVLPGAVGVGPSMAGVASHTVPGLPEQMAGWMAGVPAC